jgi:hypothetical protein
MGETVKTLISEDEVYKADIILEDSGYYTINHYKDNTYVDDEEGHNNLFPNIDVATEVGNFWINVPHRLLSLTDLTYWNMIKKQSTL